LFIYVKLNYFITLKAGDKKQYKILHWELKHEAIWVNVTYRIVTLVHNCDIAMFYYEIYNS
jgi:hypothetical protein